MTAWLLVLLVCTTTTRLTWLINEDDITAPLRRWADKRDDRKRPPPRPGADPPWTPGPWMSFLLCPWCVSIWVGAPVATVAVLWPTNRLVIIGLAWFTASLFAGVVVGLVRKFNQ